MSRAQSVAEADVLSDKLSEALGQLHQDVVKGLLAAIPPPHGVSLKDAKRALRELSAMIGHSERHRLQIEALVRMAKSAEERLAGDVAYVTRTEEKT